jgi:hypothetical protein
MLPVSTLHSETMAEPADGLNIEGYPEMNVHLSCNSSQLSEFPSLYFEKTASVDE